MHRLAALAALVLVAGCSTATPPPPMDPVQARAAAEPAVTALTSGDFAAAASASDQALRDNRGNSVAAVVHALAGYQQAGAKFRDELFQVLEGGDDRKRFDHPRGRAAWNEFVTALARVDADLAIAANDPAFTLELCLACWAHDWNHSGEVDDNDVHLFQIEVDAQGNELAEDDPRRKPTFRFDTGDIYWARAMIAFQRALSELVLAYKWDELDRLLAFDDFRKLTIEVDDPGRVLRARDLIRAGLEFSDKSRALYLVESDDDREWVPNPRQADHPVPLVMDQAMYDTWAAVTRDVRAIVDGKEGIDLGELVGPRYGALGLVNVGELLAHPRDLTLDLTHLLGRDQQGVALVVRELLGPALVDHMPKSPLVGRLLRMSRELDRDEDTFDRKLRYFLWIN